MTFRSPLRGNATVTAELLSAGGSVLKVPLRSALKVMAESSRGDNIPYGVVVTHEHVKPAAGRAWQSYVLAWNRVGKFLETRHGMLRASTHMRDLNWPADMQPVLSFGTTPKTSAELIQTFVEESYTKSFSSEDVFLLFTPEKLQEMLGVSIPDVPTDPCVIHVIGKGTTPAAVDADAPTLAWRQHFANHIPMLSGQEVAREGGYQARNTSAAANRLSEERRIFSVRHGGKLLYPAFQFRHGMPLPVVARILQNFENDPTGWDTAFFFAAPNAYLGGDKPMERLNDDKMEEELVRLAERHTHPADVF